MKTRIGISLFTLGMVALSSCGEGDAQMSTLSNDALSSDIVGFSADDLATFNDPNAEFDTDESLFNEETPLSISEINKDVSGLIEGDIVPNSNIDISNDISTKAAVDRRVKYWPNSTINVLVSSKHQSPEMMSAIGDAFNYMKEKIPALRIISDLDTRNAIVFSDEHAGCFSAVGMAGGRQPLNLGSGCLSRGTVVHEIMHALGAIHEHVRADRDEFVTVHWNRIQQGKSHNFSRYRDEDERTLCKFSFHSIMLYSSYAFSKGSLPTITKKDGSTFSASRNLSKCDVELMNRIYN